MKRSLSAAPMSLVEPLKIISSSHCVRACGAMDSVTRDSRSFEDNALFSSFGLQDHRGSAGASLLPSGQVGRMIKDAQKRDRALEIWGVGSLHVIDMVNHQVSSEGRMRRLDIRASYRTTALALASTFQLLTEERTINNDPLLVGVSNLFPTGNSSTAPTSWGDGHPTSY